MNQKCGDEPRNQSSREGDVQNMADELRGKLSTRDLQMLAAGWDAAVAACCYEDGTPLELVSNNNPYR